MSGKLKLKGDMGLAMKLGSMFSMQVEHQRSGPSCRGAAES